MARGITRSSNTTKSPNAGGAASAKPKNATHVNGTPAIHFLPTGDGAGAAAATSGAEGTNPPEWANWCLTIGDYILAADNEGVHINVTLAGGEDVGKRCKNCKREDPTILETDQLVAKSANPFHIECAVKLRKEWEAKINAKNDERCVSTNAKSAAKASFEKVTKAKKPRQALAKGTKLDVN